MRIFNTSVSPADYTSDYLTKGYAHIKNGIHKDFLKFTQDTLAQQKGKRDMKEWEFKGKKKQYLFEFPEEDSIEKIFDYVATVANLPRNKMTLCERHLKDYESDAKPFVPPHKDRLQAELTVGIPLHIPKKSHVVLYPDNELTINPYSSTAEWRDSLDEDQLPENLLKNIEPVKVYAQPGDIILFRGNSIYHERKYPAGASLLYLKFNAMRLDPIGEDPSTLVQRQKSLVLLENLSDEQILKSKLEVSPRLDKVIRYYSRSYWKEVLKANLWGEKPFVISEQEFFIFKNILDNSTVEDVMQRLAIPHPERLQSLDSFKRLGKLGGIDFLG